MKTFAGLALALLLSTALTAEVLEINGAMAKKTVTLKAGDALVVQGSMHEVTVTGEGGRLEINGSGHTVHLTGSARSVELNGSGNSLRIDAAVETLAVHGAGNQVKLVQRSGRALPQVEKSGFNNEVLTVQP